MRGQHRLHDPHHDGFGLVCGKALQTAQSHPRFQAHQHGQAFKKHGVGKQVCRYEARQYVFFNFNAALDLQKNVPRFMHVQLSGCVVGRDVVKNIAPALNTFHQSVTPIARLKGFVNQGHHQLIQSLGDLSVQGFHVLKVAKNSAQANLRYRCDVLCRRGGVTLANEMDESDNNFFPRFDTAIQTAIDGRSRRNRDGFISE